MATSSSMFSDAGELWRIEVRDGENDTSVIHDSETMLHAGIPQKVRLPGSSNYGNTKFICVVGDNICVINKAGDIIVVARLLIRTILGVRV